MTLNEITLSTELVPPTQVSPLIHSHIAKRLHKMSKLAGDLRLKTDNTEAMDVFNADMRWPLTKANSPPLWQRRGHSHMCLIFIPDECPKEVYGQMQLKHHVPHRS
jgi:hypothetical protein